MTGHVTRVRAPRGKGPSGRKAKQRKRELSRGYVEQQTPLQQERER